MARIDKADGKKLAKLTIDLDREASSQEVMQYHVKSRGEKETEFELPRYDIFLGWIEIFGIPPVNEWVLLREFKTLNKSFTGEIDGQEYTEELSITGKGVAGTKIELDRKSGKDREQHKVREVEYSRGATSGGLALFDIQHSQGEYKARLVRTIAESPKEMEKLKQKLGREERKYLEEIIEQNGEPSIVVLKESIVDGSTPPIYQKMFPFWETTEFKKSEIRSIEIGYLEAGDNEKEIDQLHGDWYKLFTLEDFDYQHLEIREGNWKSTEIEFEGEEKATKKHYEKHLYEY